MAIYDYECTKCQAVREVTHGMSKSPKVKCNECKGTMVKVFLTATPIKIPYYMQASPSFKEIK